MTDPRAPLARLPSGATGVLPGDGATKPAPTIRNIIIECPEVEVTGGGGEIEIEDNMTLADVRDPEPRSAHI